MAPASRASAVSRSTLLTVPAPLEAHPNAATRVRSESLAAKSRSWRARANAAASRYRELAMLYVEQRNLYSAPRFPRRLSVFGNLVTKHGYRPYWGLGRRALIKDASLGVLLGPRLRRPVDA